MRIRHLTLLLMLLAPALGMASTPVASLAQSADPFAAPAFRALWETTDGPIAAGQADHTWLWGPAPASTGRQEAYAEAPGGQRLVQYFDKSRMEDNSWREPGDSPWRVTNGLLVVELVTGRAQLGDTGFAAEEPARVNVAGDPGSGPTYADLTELLASPPLADGALVTAGLAPGGQVEVLATPPAEARVGHLAPTNHTIAEPFWAFMNGVGAVAGNPFFATGYPITEPYWTRVSVEGQARDVLLQCFERRCLTYTPDNPAGWQVEMGNVGRHYYQWRYGAPPNAGVTPTGPLRAAPLQIPPVLQEAVQADKERRFVDQQINLPEGFSVNLFALVPEARFMAFSPAGDLYVAQPWTGLVTVARDINHDGAADETKIFARDLNQPHSLAFHEGGLYVGESDKITRLEDRDGDLVAESRTVIVPDLPNKGQHWSRTVAFGPDGKLYVSIGSSCNACNDSNPYRASIWQFNADGSGGRVFAKGLRNSVGLAFQPGSGQLYATENGRDNISEDKAVTNDSPPEEINAIRDGGDYGWPRCHGADIRDPRFGQAPNACDGVVPPAVLMQAHSAPLGLAFVASPATFPVSYTGDLIVAFHGSWNRTEPTGYKLVRVPFHDGQPTGAVEDFLTGFLTEGGAWSRPVGVVFGPDGALYVSDDRGGGIFRITYAPSGA